MEGVIEDTTGRTKVLSHDGLLLPDSLGSERGEDAVERTQREGVGRLVVGFQLRACDGPVGIHLVWFCLPPYPTPPVRVTLLPVLGV